MPVNVMMNSASGVGWGLEGQIVFILSSCIICATTCTVQIQHSNYYHFKFACHPGLNYKCRRSSFAPRHNGVVGRAGVSSSFE